MSSMLIAAWTALDYRLIGIIKGAVALSAAAVLAWGAVAQSVGRPDAYRRTRDTLLAVLGVIGLLCWWNLGRFHYGAYVHVHEQYHYYLGSKYFRELGYERLYQCTAIADVDAGLLRQVKTHLIRNLRTNELEPPNVVIRDPTACKGHFTADRWQMFERDVDWFRAHTPSEQWTRTRVDHGYNATPVWGMVGGLLSGFAPASNRQILALALLDPLLLVAMWGFVWWAFGWRALCVAAIWWGTNYPARFYWTGGAFLRTDWLVLSVVGICLVKRGRPAAGGFALMYAALLRVFPALIIAGLALKAMVEMYRVGTISLAPGAKAFAKGASLALLLLLPLSAVVVGGGPRQGIDAWLGFVTNSRKHVNTPLTNNIGLKTLVSYDLDSTAAKLEPYWVDVPLDAWLAARRRVFDERKWVYWALVAAFVVLLARAVRDQEDWVALVLGVALIAAGAELTSYYYAVFLIFGLLWIHDRWAGVGLCLLSALTSVVPLLWSGEDAVYAVISAVVVLYVIAATGHLALSRTVQPAHLST